MPFAQVIENDYCIEIKLKFYLLSEKCIGGDISEDLDGESFFFNILEYMDALRSCFLLPGKKAFFFFSLSITCFKPWSSQILVTLKMLM